MQLKYALSGGVGALALALWSLPATAAPVSGSTWDLHTATGTSNVEQVAYRRCHWRNGRRVCRWYDGPRTYGYRAPIYNDPDAYPTGSSRWWQEMDRQDRGGRGRP